MAKKVTKMAKMAKMAKGAKMAGKVTKVVFSSGSERVKVAKAPAVTIMSTALTVSEKKLMENPLAVPVKFLPPEAQQALQRHKDKLQYFNPYSKRWVGRMGGSGSLNRGFAYRVNPDAVCVPDPEEIYEEKVVLQGGYWRAGTDGVILSDAVAAESFRGFRYPDGEVRQMLDRAYGVPTHVLIAEGVDDD